MNNVKTIGSISIRRSSEDAVYIRIEDDHSGDRILEMELTLENYGLLLTGLGGIKGEMVVNKDAHVAMEREGKRVVVPEIKKYQDKELTAKLVTEHFMNTELPAEGWILSDNGTRSQQNNPKGYEYIVKRYVPVQHKDTNNDL